MPRFYFDTFNGSLWVGDPEGIECPDVEAAMELAKGCHVRYGAR